MSLDEVKKEKELVDHHADILGRRVYELIQKYGVDRFESDKFIHDKFPIVVMLGLSAVLTNVASMLYVKQDGQDAFLNCISTRINQIRKCVASPGEEEVH